MMRGAIIFLGVPFVVGIMFIGCGPRGDKVFGVNELVDNAAADRERWQGKEVTVSGYVMLVPSSHGTNGYALTIKDNRDDESERYVDCKVETGVPPQDILSKMVEVKGKIGQVTTQNYLNMKRVVIDPCELKR